MSADSAAAVPSGGGANVPSASHNGELVNEKIAKVIEKNRQAADKLQKKSNLTTTSRRTSLK